ncbi:site-specific DNA-methyltransferase [Paraburkholderia bannensis]|uniref:Methyltransferase n=1 Tax=Paraburkholderia tropica TaxID=92647 RepID=A0AAQ1GDX3_9BURK|nr:MULTISPECIES: site-specific DNA-methyltransferase [Paraburkholderia]RQM50634.1 site-specific DNA-methyltransferase [Paraburkholderia bannensis]RQN40634.1 site-specific DNA-methyltransferase [Paraburkholderia tropica]SEJ42239.1 site-specific DNA-methyltransferase (adenine-specific) [Paraburkholderia tropica]
MRDEFDEPTLPAATGETGEVSSRTAEQEAAAALAHAAALPAAAVSVVPPAVPDGIRLLNRDFLTDAANLPDASIDLIVADPPYGLGKDYGNDSDMRSGEDFLAWTYGWLDLAIPKLKASGSLYVFCTWQYAPEIFVYLKSKMTMINEIVWDRRVPSMGGTTRRFTSVHDNIGFFAVSKDYYFDLDPVRIPYDAATKKARSRKLFEGSKWLELGYNPKDVWSVSRLHRQHAERVDHPTQKPLEIVERMVLASCPPGGRVLDPFMGSGTTAVACARQKREFVGYEINESYCAIARERVSAAAAAPASAARATAVAAGA